MSAAHISNHKTTVMGSSDFYGVFPYLVWPIDEAGEATTASEISGPIRTTRSMSAANHPLSEDERSRIRASIGKVTRVAATRLGEAGDAETLMQGTADACRERGLDVSAQELCAAVLAALRDPDAEARWFRGEAVFADRCP